MTGVVCLTIDLGGRFISNHQQVHGQITEETSDYIMFKDFQEEEEPPRKIYKRTITKIERDVTESSPPLVA